MRDDIPGPQAPAPAAPAPASTAGCPAMPPLFDWEFAADPYPAYAWLREHEPVRKTRLPSGVEAWLVTRYADARQALADQRLSKNPNLHKERSAHGRGKVGIPGERSANLMTHLLNIDPPDHTRLRRLVSKAFTPARVAEFEPRVRELTEGFIDAIIARQQPSGGGAGRGAAEGAGDGAVEAVCGEADLIDEFAFPLPIYAICDMLGVPAQDQDDFRDWAGMMLRHEKGPRGGVGRAVKKMRAYLAELIERKRAGPGDDLISGLIRASDHGEQLSTDEAAAMAFILLFAGFETTVNLIGNGTYALLRHPAERRRLQAALNGEQEGGAGGGEEGGAGGVEEGGAQAGGEASAGEALLASAVEELLRYDGPVEIATWRFATAPLTLGGQRIAAGEPVLVVLAAADRDPARFTDPDRLDLGRRESGHLGYGHGIHYCLGAPLARLEARTALAVLLRRLPDLELAADPAELRWRGGLIMRGLRSLPVRFTARDAEAGDTFFPAQTKAGPTRSP